MANEKAATPKSVLDLAKKSGAKMVDIKFVDTFGTWQHFSVPVGELTDEVFAEGFGFDGSSIRGWKSIEAPDMLAMPDPSTAFIDPFCAVPTPRGSRHRPQARKIVSIPLQTPDRR